MHFKTLVVAAAAAVVAVSATEDQQLATAGTTENIEAVYDMSADASKIMWNPYPYYYPYRMWGPYPWGRYPWRRSPIFYKRGDDETAHAKASVTEDASETTMIDEELDVDEADASKFGFWPYYRRPWWYRPWYRRPPIWF